MDQAFLQRLEQWHQEDAFEKIIQAIEEIPREQWGTGLTGLLARAYSNAARGGERPEYHEKAMELLNSAPEEGEPDWNFRMGFALYWLDREREAASYFRRVLELIPEDPESQAHWADCRELLAVCEEEAEKRELTARYLADPMNEQLALDYLLRCDLHGSLMTPDVLENGRICLPEWRLTLRPEVEQLQPNAVSLNFYLSSPDWDDPLFECSVALGADTHQALGLASGSFRFSFLQGIARMAAGEEPHEELDTTFAGAPHHWSVYLSNVVGLGNSPQLEGPQVYWNALRDGILRRLGNQKLCYVKVYGAKVNGEVTGECRIDDVKSEELSAVVAKLVESWEVEDFASHKMFFFLRQREDTILPNPYSGPQGRRLLRDRVQRAAELFHACDSEEEYEALEARLARELEDPVLAGECHFFLPEICAENAFPQLSCSEAVRITVGDQPPVSCYKNQLSDYWPLRTALFDLFSSGAFGEETNSVYNEYISVSSIYNVVRQMLEQGTELEDARLTQLLYRMGDGFVIR